MNLLLHTVFESCSSCTKQFQKEYCGQSITITVGSKTQTATIEDEVRDLLSWEKLFTDIFSVLKLPIRYAKEVSLRADLIVNTELGGLT